MWRNESNERKEYGVIQLRQEGWEPKRVLSEEPNATLPPHLLDELKRSWRLDVGDLLIACGVDLTMLEGGNAMRVTGNKPMIADELVG